MSRVSGFFSGFSRFPIFIQPTFSTFISSLLVISYSHSFISYHPSPHSWLGKIVGLAHHRCLIMPLSGGGAKGVRTLSLRPGADQSSKAAFCKSAFAKSKLTFSKSAFARSRFASRQSIFTSQKAMVWPCATSKMFSPKTCQNVLESIFAFC